MLVARGDRWLLSVRGPGVDYAPGSIGLIGGHLEIADAGPDVLETAARREVREETGLDLAGTSLRYLESTLFDDGGGWQLSVTFVVDEAGPGATPEGAARTDPAVRAPDELAEVGWWTAAEAAADPRCPDWLPALLERAAGPGRSGGLSR